MSHRPVRFSPNFRRQRSILWRRRGLARISALSAVIRRTFSSRQLLFSITFLVAGFLGALTSAPLWAQGGAPPVIQSVEFRGNRRVPTATIRARIRAKAGDPYDENLLRGDFMALFNSGLFEDIKLTAEDGENGKIVIFEFKEKPTIRSIEYKGNKSVTTSDILDRFKERKVGLSVESRFEATRIKKAEVVLKQLLSEHGRQYATVTVDIKQIPPSSVALTFNMDEGPKVKIRHIDFEGNEVISRLALVRSMKHSRPYGIPYSIFLENLISKTYDKNKLDEDTELVRGAYQDKGYFKVTVNEPKIQTVTVGGGMHIPLLKSGKPGRVVDITIPLLEGDQYHLGSMTFRGVKLFKTPDKALRPLFSMADGDIFDVSKVRKGLENLRKVYGEYGYINFVASPDTEINDQEHTIDMVFNIEEDKQFTVRRIDFSGNTTTRDKVIRRELLLQEGSLFNSRLWELSLLRLNQLGYFEKLDPKDTDIQPNNNTGTVDIDLKVKEKGKNSIGFSGGVSGLAGSFVGFNYTTNNFLGQGETLTLEAQLGSLERNIVLGLTHPYVFDRPLQAGFTVYSNRYNFNEAQQASILAGQNLAPIINLVGAQNVQNYRQSSYGLTTFASYPLHNNFSRIGLTYGYDISNITSFSEASTLYFQYINFNGLNGPNALTGIKTSKVVPTYQYSTVNSPLNPTHGTSFFASVELAGLGGNVRTWRPTVEFKYFHPAGGNRTLATHLLASTMSGYGGRLIPPFTRSYMGGETDIRGFDFFTISPIVFIPDTTTINVLNADGSQRTTTGLNNLGQEAQQPQTMTVPINRITFPGGDTKFVENLEYRIPIFGPVTLALFGDAGINMAMFGSQLELTDQRLADLQSQFPDVAFQKKLVIAPGTNSKLRVSTGIELQVVLPIVNAPFRVYWAYNPLRFEGHISPPPIANPALFPNAATFQSYITSFGSPNAYAEPAHTFRFTIGRTF